MAKSGKPTKKMSDLPNKKVTSGKANEIRGGKLSAQRPATSSSLKAFPGVSAIKVSRGPS